MKKNLLALSLTLFSGVLLAQTPEDALRYSWLQNSGTARSQGIANANGAIGGEISTIFSNPANIGFYKTGDFVISGGLNLLNNNTTYLGQSTKDNKTSGLLGTTGFVIGKPNYGNGSLKGSAFGIAINRVADFNNRITYTNKGGEVSRTSMANMFNEMIDKGYSKYGKGYKQTNEYYYGPGLAFDTYWTDTLANGNLYSPASALAASTGIVQRQEIVTNGGITEIAFAGAANLNDNVYIGGAIGLPVLRYGANRVYQEQDPSESNTTNDFNRAYFEDDLVTKGVGINVKAGVVFKATDNFRVGVFAHSPTFYSLSDNYTAYAETDMEGYPSDGKNFHSAETKDPLIFDYNLQTPYKLGASFSLLFGNIRDVQTQKGFLSGDVEYVNYMASTFRNTSDNRTAANQGAYRDLNNAIDNAYKGAVNARLGAELKFSPIAVRFGGAYYGNPYKEVAGAKGEVVQATGGLGYRNKGFFIDLGYVHSFGKDVVYPYRLTSADFYPANIKSSNARILLTLGFKI